MDIKKIKQENFAQLNLIGRLDAVTSVDLQEAIEDVLKDSNVVSLVLDFDKLEYTSSAGLRVILNAQKNLEKDGHTMKIINVNDDVMSVFQITGFDEILSISRK